MKSRPFHERLQFALEGLAAVWQRERSFRTQVGLAVVAMAVTAALRPGWVWAALVALSIALVLALELMNSALEYLIDRMHPAIAPEIKAGYYTVKVPFVAGAAYYRLLKAP